MIIESTTNEEFKKNFSADVLKKSSTLRLKAKFHLINYIMMCVSHVMLEESIETDEFFYSDPFAKEIELRVRESRKHILKPIDFMTEHENRCIYKVSQESSFDVQITELAPYLFQQLRNKFKVSNNELLQAFSPSNNFQAIHGFQTGSGQSNSFFLFSDSKKFVLKTLKPSEEELMFGKKSGIFKHYFCHM